MHFLVETIVAIGAFGSLLAFAALWRDAGAARRDRKLSIQIDDQTFEFEFDGTTPDPQLIEQFVEAVSSLSKEDQDAVFNKLERHRKSMIHKI